MIKVLERLGVNAEITIPSVHSFVLGLELSYLSKRERFCGRSFSQYPLKYQSNLGMVSYAINAAVKHVLAFSLPALTSSRYIQFLFLVHSEDYNLGL